MLPVRKGYELMGKPNKDRQDLSRQAPSVGQFVASIIRLAGLLLLLIIVAAKIKQIAPDIRLAGWVVLLVAFVLLTLGAIRFSTLIVRRTKISESSAEWIAVIILVATAVLVAYLVWPF
jgi:hypothetical protein